MWPVESALVKINHDFDKVAIGRNLNSPIVAFFFVCVCVGKSSSLLQTNYKNWIVVLAEEGRRKKGELG